VTNVPVIRVERAVYGVEDVPECERFFRDLGLSPGEVDGPGARLRTRAGQVVELRPNADPGLPPPIESPNTLREVVWGVSDQASFDDLVDRVSVDRDVAIRDGVAHTVDETGYGVGLAVAAPDPLVVDEAGYNRTGAVARLNQPRTFPGPVHPLRLCHVALNIPKAGRQEARAFYTDRLGFKVTDDVLDMGVFLRADGDADQHTMLLCHRPDKAGIYHTAYEVEGFDQVVVGVNQMIEKGWREARRLGRHTVGSNVLRFVHAPCGGRVELAADMDRVDDTYGPNVHEETPPHHIWQLAGNRDQGSDE
jgi:catechol 2,3-dioxygenase-like lactoylglutathione lyase family enzyme